MSNFNRFCAKVRRAAIALTDKAEAISDNAAAAVRAKSLQIRIDEQYENLGRIVYRDLHTEENLEEEKLAVIAEIDALFDELEASRAPATDEDEDGDGEDEEDKVDDGEDAAE